MDKTKFIDKTQRMTDEQIDDVRTAADCCGERYVADGVEALVVEVSRARDESARLRAALETWQMLGVECLVDGGAAPRPTCTCNTCETWCEGDAALKGAGHGG